MIQWWSNLKHQYQAGIVIFLAAFGAPVLQTAEDSGMTKCPTWGCVWGDFHTLFAPHIVFTALVAGVAAWRLFYTVPNKAVPPNSL